MRDPAPAGSCRHTGSSRRWSAAATRQSTVGLPGSNTTRSASWPGAIAPFPLRLNRRAGVADEHADERSRSGCPAPVPLPGRPGRASRLRAHRSGCRRRSGRTFSESGQGAWSDATTSTVPRATASHSASWSSRSRSGGFIFSVDPAADHVLCGEGQVVRAGLDGRVETRLGVRRDDADRARQAEMAEVGAASHGEAVLGGLEHRLGLADWEAGMAQWSSGFVRPCARKRSMRGLMISSFSAWKHAMLPQRVISARTSRSSASGTRGKRFGSVSKSDSLNPAAPAATSVFDLAERRLPAGQSPEARCRCAPAALPSRASPGADRHR